MQSDDDVLGEEKAEEFRRLCNEQTNLYRHLKKVEKKEGKDSQRAKCIGFHINQINEALHQLPRNVYLACEI